MNIGIVGQGYVGTAVKTVFEKHYKVNTFDLNGKCSCTDIEDLVAASDIIFVCVPTPMKKDGSCDTSIVESVVKDIDEISGEVRETLCRSELARKKLKWNPKINLEDWIKEKL